PVKIKLAACVPVETLMVDCVIGPDNVSAVAAVAPVLLYVRLPVPVLPLLVMVLDTVKVASVRARTRFAVLIILPDPSDPLVVPLPTFTVPPLMVVVPV